MKTALFCASAVFGSHGVLFAAAANVQISRRSIRGLQPGLDAEEPAVEPDTAMESLSAIPPLGDVGPDGFPQLPAVTNLMNSAQSTAQSLTAQAISLENRVAEVQKEKAARMAKQKEIFELKLKDQEQENRDLLAQNQQVAHDIAQLRVQNAGITKHAHELSDADVLMRSELSAQQSSLKTAGEFVKQSLSTTDDSLDTELAVLDAKVQANFLRKTEMAKVQPQRLTRAAAAKAVSEPAVAVSEAVPLPIHPAADEDSEDPDGDDDSVALVAISSTVREVPVVEAADAVAVSDPANLLLTLEGEVKALQTQEQAGEKQLKEMFFKDFQLGAKRKSALIAQQKILNTTRDSLTSLQAKLKVAESHLQATKDSLTSRLHQLGTFIQMLGHLATAPAAEVPRLLQSLPASVAGDEADRATATADVQQ